MPGIQGSEHVPNPPAHGGLPEFTGKKNEGNKGKPYII